MIAPTFTSHRSPVLARRGMAASSQPLASQAGLSILMQGGNAADAAVAIAAALDVTEPTSTGIGGDCFALYYDAKTSGVTALNGSGRAPGRADRWSSSSARAWRKTANCRPFTPTPSPCPAPAPAGATWSSGTAACRWPSVLAPAIRLAEDGFPVAPLTAYSWARGVERQLSNAPGGQELTIDGRAPRAGEIFRNPGLARTLRAVAEGGKAAPTTPAPSPRASRARRPGRRRHA